MGPKPAEIVGTFLHLSRILTASDGEMSKVKNSKEWKHSHYETLQQTCNLCGIESPCLLFGSERGLEALPWLGISRYMGGFSIFKRTHLMINHLLVTAFAPSG